MAEKCSLGDRLPDFQVFRYRLAGTSSKYNFRNDSDWALRNAQMATPNRFIGWGKGWDLPIPRRHAICKDYQFPDTHLLA